MIRFLQYAGWSTESYQPPSKNFLKNPTDILETFFSICNFIISSRMSEELQPVSVMAERLGKDGVLPPHLHLRID